ncbi:C40 family peptidase [Lentzea guizhouensis]|uniref:C40 family peptidase n=1 Tax=Lentzea guizhouensis TaxID=1586287 RepID=UPI001F21D46B|nr:C40 family peptidase [Lentzea guizhouensis]
MATAAVVAAALPTAPATAQPTAADALKKYNELNEQASRINQDQLKAQDDLKAKQGELDKAKTDLAAAKQAEETLRGQVDLLTEASFGGARFNQLSALLVSNSQQDFLNRMTAINILATDNAEALKKLTDAVEAADTATRTANEATEASKKLLAEIDQKKVALAKQIEEVRAQYNQLNTAARNAISSRGDMSSILVPPGTAGKALEFALAQRGEPYVYGSNGPDSWDCSSLIQKAYAYAGVSIGRTSYAQAAAGRPVSRSEVKAGDILVYYSSQSHVAMAIDGTRAVHASTEGQPVKIADINSIGPVTGIRRIEG